MPKVPDINTKAIFEANAKRPYKVIPQMALGDLRSEEVKIKQNAKRTSKNTTSDPK